MEAQYDPSVFNVSDIASAQRIILTPERGTTTAERWRKETPYLLSLIEQQMPLNDQSIVLDYGCGIGRMAKALIEKYNCGVVGVDISPSMRALAAAYVGSGRFFACAPQMLHLLNKKFDAALAIWTLQHCLIVEDDIAQINAALKANGQLFIVNDWQRIVPTNQGWMDDKKDVAQLLGDRFSREALGHLDEEQCGIVAACSYWAAFRKTMIHGNGSA